MALNKHTSANGKNADSTHERRSETLRMPSNTFEAQARLPRLPIPSLEETCAKFPKFVEALQTPEERADTLEVVDDFLKNDGPKFQKLLIDYDKEGKETESFGSYVEEFWNDSYLAPDSSVVLNLNPYFILEKGPDRKIAHDQLMRAACLTFASLKMASMLKNESLPPDNFKGRPLCMDQFNVLFGSCRVPEGKGIRDHVDHYPDSTHICVLIKNQVYYFQGLWPHDGSVAVDQHDIKDILEAIKKHAEYVTSGKDKEVSNGKGKKKVDDHLKKVNICPCDEALGVLTSLPRTEWAAARKMIMEGDNEGNKRALHVIDSALFVLVLDDNVPKDINEAAANMLHGTTKLVKDPRTNTLVQVGSCCNRWYDKLQLIVMANGKAGVNFEHSSIDGHTALRYVSDIFAENVVQFAQSITALVYGNGWIPDNMHAQVRRENTTMGQDTCNKVKHEDGEHHAVLDVFPKKLEFHLPPKVKEIIRYAETNLGDQIIASDTEVLEFQGYGKKQIVKSKMSPDSFVQMSMMMAYYKLYGKFVCSYEPVLTKAFYHGRTEAMRGATPQAKKLCETWCNPHATKLEKLEALRVATVEHSRLVKECAFGKGVDRHLFALKCIAKRHNLPIPKLFESEAWKTLNHTVLSTSNCGNPSLRLFGFGPVVQDGFGIGYIIKDDALAFAIASKHRQTLRFANTLENVLIDLGELLASHSHVICSGHHHNHVIHPVHNGSAAVQKEDDYYDDFWGESALEKSEDLVLENPKPLARRDSEGGKVFSTVKTRAISFSEHMKVGLQLSFDESVENSSSGVEGYWYNKTDSSSVRSSDSGSDNSSR